MSRMSELHAELEEARTRFANLPSVAELEHILALNTAATSMHPWFVSHPDGYIDFDGEQAWFCPDQSVRAAVPVGGTLLAALLASC